MNFHTMVYNGRPVRQFGGFELALIRAGAEIVSGPGSYLDDEGDERIYYVFKHNQQRYVSVFHHETVARIQPVVYDRNLESWPLLLGFVGMPDKPILHSVVNDIHLHVNDYLNNSHEKEI